MKNKITKSTVALGMAAAAALGLATPSSALALEAGHNVGNATSVSSSRT